MKNTLESATARAQTPFKNQPFIDFSKEENRKAQIEALEQVKSELGRKYPLIIGGKKIMNEDTFTSVNPSQPDQVIGYFSRATVEQANAAVQAAATAFESWKHVPAEERAAYLFAAADLMRQRRFYFNAWMIYEVGKSWAEADGDTAEAIDLMEFYARDMLRLAGEQPLTHIEAEENELVYVPLGVGAVIPPWNFPCAIMVGMTSAAFVAGNTVVLKPASTSPAIAAQFVRVLEKVGLPAGVVNFLTGSGSAIGDAKKTDKYMGPVVDENAMKKITEYIEIGKGEGRLVAGGGHHGPGYFIEPTIIADVDPHARVAQEEIFGPVLAFIKAKDFDDAMHIANDTEYGLTGSLYSQDPQRIERAKEEYFVGNLYFNRKSTGALVGVHPFGGFNMSGTDSKAGGPDYLLLFTQAKAISTKK